MDSLNLTHLLPLTDIALTTGAQKTGNEQRLLQCPSRN